MLTFCSNLVLRFLFFISLLFSLSLGIVLSAQEQAQVDEKTPIGDSKLGKKLFNTNCASCHTLDKKLIGPALRDISLRRDKGWLVDWIKDNAALRASGDADAKAIFEEYNGSVMSSFPFLSDKDIDDILAYTSEPVQLKQVAGQDILASGAVGTSGQADDTKLSWYIFLFVFLLAFVLFILIRIKNAIRRRAYQDQAVQKTPVEEVEGFLKAVFVNRYVLVFISLFLVFYGAKSCWDGSLSIGVDQGYQPIQPIAFSHKIHAGDNKIDCKYCHSGVRTSKFASIPSVNVCMNCHKYIQEGATTGSKEIAKIYEAIGFDPKNSEYIKGYEQKPVKWVRVHRL